MDQQGPVHGPGQRFVERAVAQHLLPEGICEESTTKSGPITSHRVRFHGQKVFTGTTRVKVDVHFSLTA